MPKRDWEARVQAEDFSDVMRLVHLAMRLDQYDVDRIRSELLAMRRRAYEDELTIQASRVGCPSRHGRLTTGPSLTQLNDISQADAERIVNTYNYDLSRAIEAIRAETPTANRHIYARRLEGWHARRDAWKAAQIAEFSEGTARSLAQVDFVRLNGVMGSARLEPRTAVCPVCQGWIKRGVKVPLRVALTNPGPFHPGCPHLWFTMPDQVAPEECSMIWVGE